MTIKVGYPLLIYLTYPSCTRYAPISFPLCTHNFLNSVCWHIIEEQRQEDNEEDKHQGSDYGPLEAGPDYIAESLEGVQEPGHRRYQGGWLVGKGGRGNRVRC